MAEQTNHIPAPAGFFAKIVLAFTGFWREVREAIRAPRTPEEIDADRSDHQTW